jgi:hypothetical protein
MRRSSLPLLAAIVALSAGTLGCSEDFAPFTRLESLRILGVKSDPPTPATGEPATLEALVYMPPGTATPTYSWSWCPFPGSANDGYACRVTEEMLADLPGGSGVPSFDLGTGETATFTNSIDPALLTAVCGGFLPGQPERLNCTNGFPIQIALTIDNGMETVKAVTTVRLRFTPTMTLDPPIYGLDSENAIPQIETLTAFPPGQGEGEIALSPVTTLPRDVGTALLATVDRDAAVETYDSGDDDGNPVTLTERLFITWYVETGDLDDNRTSFTNDATAPFVELQKNIWTPARSKDYAPSTARLYVVLHDNRGGVSWKFGTVNLEPTP